MQLIQQNIQYNTQDIPISMLVVTLFLSFNLMEPPAPGVNV